MNNLNMYCICLHNNDYDVVKKLGYIPVGLGKNKFSSSSFINMRLSTYSVMKKS